MYVIKSETLVTIKGNKVKEIMYYSDLFCNIPLWVLNTDEAMQFNSEYSAQIKMDLVFGKHKGINRKSFSIVEVK